MAVPSLLSFPLCGPFDIPTGGGHRCPRRKPPDAAAAQARAFAWLLLVLRPHHQLLRQQLHLLLLLMLLPPSFRFSPSTTRLLGIEYSVRVAPYIYNTRAEIDEFIQALQQAIRDIKGRSEAAA